MAKRKNQQLSGDQPFGNRLAYFRKAAGYTQRDLAPQLGVSQRVIAYYEGETQYPPSHLLPRLARVLGVSTDQLLGLEKETITNKPKDSRLKRRFAQVEKLPESERKHIAQYLDRILKAAKLSDE